MRKWKNFSCAFVSLAIGVAAGFATLSRAASPERQIHIADGSRMPDLIIQTAFDEKAQAKIFGEVRAAVRNATGFDPLSHRFAKPLHLEAKFGTKMETLLRQMIEGLIRFPFGKGDVLVDIEGLRYETPKAGFVVGAAKKVPNGIDVPITVRLHETKVSAERVYLHFRSNQKTRSFLDKFYIELHGPSLYAKDLDSLTFELTVSARTAADGSTTLSLSEDSFKSFEAVSAEDLSREMVFDAGKVSIPPGTFIQMGAVLPLSESGLTEALQIRRAALADLVFRPLTKEIRALPEKFIHGKKIRSIQIPARIPADIPCLGPIDVSLARYGLIGGNQLFIGLKIEHPDYRPTPGWAQKFEKSTDVLYDKIAHRQASLGAGLRDRFVAWALKNALTGCLREKLPPALSVGPKGVWVQMDEQDGVDGVVAVHAQSNLKKIPGWLMGARMIEFPLKVSPNLNFGSGDASPKFVLDLRYPDLSDEVLLRGYAGIPSNIPELRLPQLALEQLKKKLREALLGSSVENMSALSDRKRERKLREATSGARIELPLEFIRGSDLSYANIESDRFGHLNLMLTLDSEVEASARGFWTTLAPYLESAFVPKADRAVRREE
jgi:hypothetical protein